MSNSFTKARSRLLLDNPFFGTLALKLLPKEDTSQPSGYTDGKVLGYNPKWFEKLSSQQQVGFIAHEIMHIVYMHIFRREQRHPKKWNVAADYVINYNLVHDCRMVLPDGALIDEQYKGMTTEHVYNLLPEMEDEDGNSIPWDDLPEDFGGSGAVRDGAPSNGSSTKEQQKWTIDINQAYEAAKMAGKLPGGLSKVIDEIVKPKVNWKAVLTKFLTSTAKNDYSWVKPNRRFLGQDMYLPSLYSERLESIVVAVDTSGSITDEELQIFASETSAILASMDPEKIEFLQCDTAINQHDTYTRESLPLKVEFKGRGGTDFAPVWEYIEENHLNPKACIYLTDLYPCDWGEQPPYPVLWISTTDVDDVPFGEVTRIQV
tara:strand:- start:398 stop:1522 length:1125 start_codon:yes stop_codon:yes gene_type:complete